MKNLEKYTIFVILFTLSYLCGYFAYQYKSYGDYNSLSVSSESDCVMIYNAAVVMQEQNNRLKKDCDRE